MSPPNPEGENALPEAVRTSWRLFFETYEPLRPALYRYCRHLTRSPWDAEDLAQDTLARAFVTLGQIGEAPPHARAWLFRVASNLWIDRARHTARARREIVAAPEAIAPPAPQDTREAAGTLLGQLSPQERAAVVLKDAFDLSLEEIAETLTTTVGAVKAALHRARGKLGESAADPPAPVPPPVLDAFCRAFNAGDLDGVTSLLLETGSVEVVGATTQYGREAAKRTVLWGMLFGGQLMARGVPAGVDPRFTAGILDAPPRVEARAHRGGWVLLHFYPHEDGEAVRALTRIEPNAAEDGIAHLANYFFNVDLIYEVCAELNVPVRTNGYRWCLPT